MQLPLARTQTLPRRHTLPTNHLTALLTVSFTQLRVANLKSIKGLKHNVDPLNLSLQPS